MERKKKRNPRQRMCKERNRKKGSDKKEQHRKIHVGQKLKYNHPKINGNNSEYTKSFFIL